jgi:hypothetical protein
LSSEINIIDPAQAEALASLGGVLIWPDKVRAFSYSRTKRVPSHVVMDDVWRFEVSLRPHSFPRDQFRSEWINTTRKSIRDPDLFRVEN